MINFDLVTQDTDTLTDFVYAVISDALEAEGCSMDLKLPEAVSETGAGDWKSWLLEENENGDLRFPDGTWIFGRTSGINNG